MLLWVRENQTKPNGHWTHGKNPGNIHRNKNWARNITHHLKKALPFLTHSCVFYLISSSRILYLVSRETGSCQLKLLASWKICVSCPQTKAYKKTDLKEKVVRGTFHSAKGIIKAAVQQVSRALVNLIENQQSNPHDWNQLYPDYLTYWLMAHTNSFF